MIFQGQAVSRLFHFSDDDDIKRFVPRAVRVPSAREAGREWLNGPLVWAIAESHDFLYLFPRDCPRILAWARSETTVADRRRWLGGAGVVAFIERDWLDRLGAAEFWRYELAPDGFEDLADAGMWVSRNPAAIVGKARLTDLLAMLAARGVRLEVMETLVPLRGLWDTSLAVSGIRLRNARGWGG